MKISEIKDVVVSNVLQESILSNLCGVPKEAIDAARNNSTREIPCPKCGGKTRFRILDLERGAVFCSHCCNNGNQGSGDIIGAVKWGQRLTSDGDAAKTIENFLIENDYISKPTRRKGGAATMNGTITTKEQKDGDDRAYCSLTMNAEGVEYAERSNPVTGKIVKTRFFHRLNPKTKATTAAKRIDYCDGSKLCNWLKSEKDAEGKTTFSPYVAGGATQDDKIDPERLATLWRGVYDAPRLYIVEGEKCADSLKKSLTACPELDGAVLTMGACNLAKDWGEKQNWAGYLKENAAAQDVFILGDNDKPGREAVKETAAAFYRAGYRSIMIYDLQKTATGEEAGNGYDIADYLEELENAPFADFGAALASFFEQDGRPFDHAQEISNRHKEETLKGRLELLDALDKGRAKRDAWTINRRDLDATFPLDALPENAQLILKALTEKFGAPYGASCAAMLTIAGGFLGVHKTSLKLDDTSEVNPLIHSCIVGGSGIGKSETVKRLLKPVMHFDGQAKKWAERERNKITILRRDLDNLNKTAPEKRTSEFWARVETLEKQIRIIEWGTPAYVSCFVSPESIGEQVYTNEIYAELEGRTTDGFILFQDDADVFFHRGGTKRDDNETTMLWSKLNGLGDGNFIPGKPVSRKINGTPKKIGVSYLTAIQPSNFTCLKCPALVGNGFLNRFLFALYPLPRLSDGVNAGKKISKELEIWNDIINAIHNFKGAAFHCGYQEALDKFHQDFLLPRREEAYNAGDEMTTAFIGKLYQIVNKIALILHILGLIEKGNRLDEAATTNGDAPPCSKINAEVFHAAVKLVRYYLESRPNVFKYVKHEAIAKQDQDAPLNLSSLEGKYRKLYDDVLKKGDPIDLLKEGDGRARAMTVTKLNNCDWYHKKKNDREMWEQTLKRESLLYVEEPKTARDQGRRVFLPDNLTLEELEEWKRLVDEE